MVPQPTMPIDFSAIVPALGSLLAANQTLNQLSSLNRFQLSIESERAKHHARGLGENYFFSSLSISGLKASKGCAPTFSKASPVGLCKRILAGVPVMPILIPSSRSSCTLDAYFPLSTHSVNCFSFRPI